MFTLLRRDRFHRSTVHWPHQCVHTPQEQKAVKDQVKKLGKKNKEEGLALQAALDARHAEELAAFDAAAALERLEVEEGDASAAPRMSKAMKRRQQRQREDAERSARIDEERAALGETLREREEAALQEQLAGEGLGVHDIVPDGHCLYRALEHQLRLQGDQGSSYQELRRAAAQHMRAHDADFRPFIAEDDLAAPSEEAADLLESYCRELESTAVWGGHLELEALSAALDRPIAVFAAEDAPQVVGAERAGPRLRVCFMRHAYGLGDHYNSVVPLSDVGSNEEGEAA